MTSTSTKNSQPQNRHTLPIMAACFVIFFIALVIWGGLPPKDERLFFLIGAAVFIGLVVLFGVIAWHLLARPLPKGHKQPEAAAFSAGQLRLLAVLLAIGGLNIVVGGFWDEVWHRKYGLPFGEDLLWRPHLLIYSTFLITIVLAFGGLIFLLKNGKGTLQQRFRANPVVGLLVIGGGFMLFVTPADPVWHLIYGEDISAWSLPHIMLLLSSSAIMLLAAAIYLTTMPLKPWRPIWQVTASEFPAVILVIVLSALAMQIGLQVLTTEWDAAAPIVLNRPAWLLPALLVGYAALMGNIANHATRLAGSATGTAVIALIIRLTFIEIFAYDAVKAYSWMGLLAPMLALDMLTLIRLRQTNAPASWQWAGIVMLLGMAIVSYPMINQLYPHTPIGWADLPATLLVGLLVAWGTAWMGQIIGDYMGAANKHVAQETDTRQRTALLPPAFFLGMVGFILWFIATATPPI